MNEQYMEQPQAYTPHSNTNNQYAYEKQNNPNLIQWQLDPKDIIKEIVDRFSGKYRDERTKKWVIDEDLKVMNKYGINFIRSILPSYINKGTIMSKYNEQEIFYITMNACGVFSRKFILSYREFEMDFDNIEGVCLSIVQQINATLKRADGGFTTKFLKATESITTNEVVRPPERKAGLLSGVKGVLKI